MILQFITITIHTNLYIVYIIIYKLYFTYIDLQYLIVLHFIIK